MPNLELSTIHLSKIDQDLRDLDEFSVEDRMEFLTDQLNRWRNEYGLVNQGIITQCPPCTTQDLYLNKTRAIEQLRKPRPDGIRFSVLPDIHHPIDHGENLYTIRDVGQSHQNFYKTEGGAVFIPVDQGHMAEVPVDMDQFYSMSMSTCSCIVGYGSERTIVAHVSYSIEMQAQQVLDHMKQKGVKPEDIYVVASQTPGVDEQLGFTVVNDVSYYTEKGIPRQNIHEFTHEIIDGIEDIVSVSVAPDAIRVAEHKSSRNMRTGRSDVSDAHKVDIIPTSHTP